MTDASSQSSNFIRDIIDEDLRTGKYKGRVHTRFPPEPNGFLHIGHAKSICLNFSIARDYNGLCNLRYDDTNPIKEQEEYIRAIAEDVKWLGFDWQDRCYFASDYFEQMFAYAEELITKGKAYVCELSNEQIREYRGTLTQPGKESPYRNRTIEENLDLFRRMRAGEFSDGAKVLRAKIDMASSNVNMRDPVIYNPMYDWAHGLEDSLEKITHSICTLEFEDHRPLYDWFLDQLEVYHPQQIEFAPLNLSYTILSKRKLTELVQEGIVSGWDDPRMPTISGLKRRGYTPSSIREFCAKIGVAKRDSLVDVALLEHCLRKELNKTAPRVMGVLKPLKVIIDNYPDNQEEQLEAVNNPEDSSMGTRMVPFSKVIYIEQDDFMEDPPKKFYRLAPGREVRLRYAYFITCVKVVKDGATGVIKELHCTYDPATKGGNAPDGRKVKATLHWVSAAHALAVEVRIYNHLFSVPNPAEVKPGQDWKETINPESVKVLSSCQVEPSLQDSIPGYRVQFERKGYFCVDPDSNSDTLIFNQIVGLRDTWVRIQNRSQKNHNK
ncbi:MAG: glutamine--tRNA ligase/YqeY domain fusion protein [bacterium]